MVVSSTYKSTRAAAKSTSQKRKSRFRKAPQAPKRFKSAYIFFSTDTMQRIKNEQKTAGNDRQKITDISKKISHAWKTLPVEERNKWELVAKKDKERFMAEKKNYKGPWQLPIKSDHQGVDSQQEEASDASLLSESEASNLSQLDGDRMCNAYDLQPSVMNMGSMNRHQEQNAQARMSAPSRLTGVSQEERDAAHNLVSLFQQSNKPKEDRGSSFDSMHGADQSSPTRHHYQNSQVHGHPRQKPLYRNHYVPSNYPHNQCVYSPYSIPKLPRQSSTRYGFY